MCAYPTCNFQTRNTLIFLFGLIKVIIDEVVEWLPTCREPVPSLETMRTWKIVGPVSIVLFLCLNNIQWLILIFGLVLGMPHVRSL